MDAMRQAGSLVVRSAVMAVAVSCCSSTSKRIACVRMRAVSVVIAFVYEGSVSGRCVRVAPKAIVCMEPVWQSQLVYQYSGGCSRCVCECSGNRHLAQYQGETCASAASSIH